MIKYQRVVVSNGMLAGVPGDLPDHLVGLDDVTLADLSAALSAATLQQLDLLDAGFLPVDVPDPPPAPAPVPTSADRYAFKVALFQAELFGEAEAFAASSGAPFSIYWSDVANVRRSDVELSTLAAALSLTSDQLDALFIAAAS